METHTFREELSLILEHTSLLAPRQTLIGLAGGEILGMARCYLSDGSRFIDRNDPVNAVASFAYAAGWLDAGTYLGIFTSNPLCRNLLSKKRSIPGDYTDHLTEKTYRYQRLLNSALSSSEPGSEKGIRWYEGGENVIMVAAAYLAGGGMFIQTGQYEDALCCFSYGHGWLDTGIRVGLIRITGNRDVFAI
jgi:uncharacterized protein